MANREELMGLLNEVIERYKPGGGFKEAGLADIARRKKKTVGKQTQSLIGAGLGGTSQAGVLGSRFEEEIGTPARLGLEHERLGALTEAMGAKAGYMEREAARQTEEERWEQQLAIRMEKLRRQGIAADQARKIAQQQIEMQQQELKGPSPWEPGFMGGGQASSGGGGGGTTHTGGSIFGGGSGSSFGGSTFGGSYTPTMDWGSATLGGLGTPPLGPKPEIPSLSEIAGFDLAPGTPSLGELGEFAQGWLNEGSEEPTSMAEISTQYHDWLGQTGKQDSFSQWMKWGSEHHPTRFA